MEITIWPVRTWPTSQKRRLLISLGSLVLVCSFLVFSPLRVFAAGATIDDQAGVLDSNQVQTAAAQLSYTILIYTTKTFTGDQASLDQSPPHHPPDQNSLALVIH